MRDQRDDDDHAQRWLDAEAALHGQLTPTAQRRSRRTRNILILVLIAAPILGFALALLWAKSGWELPSAGDASDTSGLEVAGLVLVVCGFIMVILGLAWLIRSKQFIPAWRSPLLNLSRRDRKELIQLIRRGKVPPAGREELARYLATKMKGQYPHLLRLAGAGVLIYSGQALIDGNAIYTWATAVLVALYLVTAVNMVRDLRRASHWLNLHGNQGKPATR
jgi:hypothetical protein